MIDTAFLEVVKVIIHDVPNVRDGSIPVLSEIESPLTDRVTSYFVRKIKQSLEKASRVVFNLESASPVPELVRSYLSSPDGRVISPSQKAARHLHACQKGNIDPGLLAVVVGTVDKMPYLALMKLEREQGVNLEQQEHEGKTTFNLEHLPNLMLGENTKLFKIGLFYPDVSISDGVAGLVCDHQKGFSPAGSVAQFWLEGYLGSRRRESPEATTERTFHAIERFINERVDSDEHKARYEMALMTEMVSSSPQFSPIDFITNHVVGPDRRALRESLKEQGISLQPFRKDAALIAPRLRHIRINFERGTKLFVPIAEYEKSVTLVDGEGKRAKVVIDDVVKDISGKQ